MEEVGSGLVGHIEEEGEVWLRIIIRLGLGLDVASGETNQ